MINFFNMIIVNIILMMQLLARQGDPAYPEKNETRGASRKFENAERNVKNAHLHDPSRDQRNIHVPEDDTG